MFRWWGDKPRKQDQSQPDVAKAGADLETYARSLLTLRRELRKFNVWVRRARGAEATYDDRRAVMGTHGFVNAPAGIVATTAVFAVAVCGPVLGVDVTGTTAGLMPSAEQLGGENGVRAIATVLGALLAVGAIVAGMMLASATHMPGTKARVATGLGIALVVGLTVWGIGTVGADRSHGLKAAALQQNADDLDLEIDDARSKLQRLKSLERRGAPASADSPAVQQLEAQITGLERQRASRALEAAEIKTTDGLTVVQIAGFVAAAFAGFYLELGTLLRLRRRIERLRGKADNAYACLFLKTCGLFAIPRRDALDASKSPGVVPDDGIPAGAQALLAEIAPKPNWRDFDDLEREFAPILQP